MITSNVTNPYSSETKDLLPLVLIKNGMVGLLQSNGLINLSAIKKLNLPNAIYDYTLDFNFYQKINGVNLYHRTNKIYICKEQTSLDVSLSGLAFIQANLILKQ